ncbi:MAG: triphosphoribosyl-dephospho-CoA synthase [Pirellulales bacterium]|nr:triphosphoribosyl-dephospho-CoA synthase [Pirellulales bacterium]
MAAISNPNRPEGESPATVPSLGQLATLASLMEVTAAKPGNVHRGADFDDVSFFEFAAGAIALGPVFELARERSLGETVLAAVRATAALVATNTNLGTILLLAPLAKASRSDDLHAGVRRVLESLTPDDAARVYLAIREAAAGGLGRVGQADVAGEPPADLVAAMPLAAERDLVARQYANGFAEVFDHVVPDLQFGLQQGICPADAIVFAHVRAMSRWPDSLIARKCGVAVAEQAARLAGQVLQAGPPGDEDYERALGDLDFWLRSDHHRRNPGTTADLLAAGLFVLLRQGTLTAPWRFYRPFVKQDAEEQRA